MSVANQPESSPLGPNGPRHRPSQPSTFINVARVRDLFASGMGIHNLAYVQALDAVLKVHGSKRSEGKSTLSLPTDPKEKRHALLDMFHSFGGKRPIEGGKKGIRGALAALERATGIDDKNLGQMLDKAIQERAAALR